MAFEAGRHNRYWRNKSDDLPPNSHKTRTDDAKGSQFVLPCVCSIVGASFCNARILQRALAVRQWKGYEHLQGPSFISAELCLIIAPRVSSEFFSSAAARMPSSATIF